MNKKIDQIYQGIPASDGDGVKLTRIIGTPQIKQLDPFLLLDAFGTDKPQDYIGGFPPHPHRGFETVTYMLDGRMRHKDSMGNEGVIGPGDVQWMRAASGIIHSEMPEQENGLLSGFQLWVNLPAKDKMSAPNYQDLQSDDIPIEQQAGGVTIKVISGQTQNTQGAAKHSINYWDVTLPKGRSIAEPIPASHNGFIYLLEGTVTLGNSAQEIPMEIHKGQLATLLNESDAIEVGSNQQLEVTATTGARFLLVTGEPLNEPIVRAGPFVMSTHEDLKQAFKDHENGQLVQ